MAISLDVTLVGLKSPYPMVVAVMNPVKVLELSPPFGSPGYLPKNRDHQR